MNRDQIIELQHAVGTEPDGFWGPKSTSACKAHLARLMPHPNPWPDPDFASMVAFYGQPGDESHLVNVPSPKWIRLYDGDTRPTTIRCHEKVAESLLRALSAAHEAAPDHVSRYFGCYNFRKMRGGRSYSKHAWGAAIDLAANTNGNHMHWPTRADMPLSVMEAFAREGWTPAGAFWSRDAMHFEATHAR